MCLSSTNCDINVSLLLIILYILLPNLLDDTFQKMEIVNFVLSRDTLSHPWNILSSFIDYSVLTNLCFSFWRFVLLLSNLLIFCPSIFHKNVMSFDFYHIFLNHQSRKLGKWHGLFRINQLIPCDKYFLFLRNLSPFIT